MVISLRIKFIKLNKHLDCPLTSKLNEANGVREVINQMDNDIDKVGLE